jgi:hypothetical protein
MTSHKSFWKLILAIFGMTSCMHTKPNPKPTRPRTEMAGPLRSPQRLAPNSQQMTSNRGSLPGVGSNPEKLPRFARSEPEAEAAVSTGKNVWRLNKPLQNIYYKALRMLSQDYIVTQANKESLTIQTDWDTFFLEGRLMRNRLSLTFYPLSPKQTEVQITNFVEYQKESTLPGANVGWIPGPDVTTEVDRLLSALKLDGTQFSSQIPVGGGNATW